MGGEERGTKISKRGSKKREKSRSQKRVGGTKRKRRKKGEKGEKKKKPETGAVPEGGGKRSARADNT